MPMSIPELERALRSLRLSGMTATLQARALQVTSHEMDFIEAFSWLVQDEPESQGCDAFRRYRTNSTGDIHACSSGVTRYRDCPSAKT